MAFDSFLWNAGNREKEIIMEFFRDLAGASCLPWCAFRDFNDILSSDEKKGRSERSSWLIPGFRQTVLDTWLFDLHKSG